MSSVTTYTDTRGAAAHLGCSASCLEKFRVAGGTLQGMFDIYNLLNSSDVLTSNGTFGPIWLKPGAVLPARLYKFNLLVNF